MASLPGRTTASFDAIKPVSSLVLLDDEFNDMKGAAGFLNGGTTGKKLLIKTSDAADPPIECDQVGAGPLAEWKQNGSLKAAINNAGDLSANGITSSAGVYTFGSHVVGPASDPTTDNQYSRKKYTDDKAFWGASWFIADPSTFPLASFNLAQKVLIPKGNYRVLTLHGIFSTGSASGSFSVELRKHPFNDQTGQTTLGTITFNSGTLGVGVDVDVTDHEFTEKDWLYLILSARSSPLQRDVSISIVGDKLGTI